MVQIICLSLIFAVIILYLKSINNELSILATIGAGIILLGYAIKYLTAGLDIIDQIINLTGVNREFFEIIFKITAIGYLVEFGAGTIAEFGLKSLADKLVFIGKILIFSLSLPIIYALLNILTGLLQ